MGFKPSFGLLDGRQQLGFNPTEIDIVVITQPITASGQFQQFLRALLFIAVKAV